MRIRSIRIRTPPARGRVFAPSRIGRAGSITLRVRGMLRRKAALDAGLGGLRARIGTVPNAIDRRRGWRTQLSRAFVRMRPTALRAPGKAVPRALRYNRMSHGRRASLRLTSLQGVVLAPTRLSKRAGSSLRIRTNRLFVVSNIPETGSALRGPRAESARLRVTKTT